MLIIKSMHLINLHFWTYPESVKRIYLLVVYYFPRNGYGTERVKRLNHRALDGAGEEEGDSHLK